MPAPRSKPLYAWEPVPFLVALVMVVGTGLIRPDGPPWAFWPFAVLLAGSLAWVVVTLVRGRRPANPDQWGDLSTLDGLEIVDAAALARGVRTVVPVADSHRHQAAIELARLHGGAEQPAVLVPRANRWLSRRYRIGVQLVGGGRPRHAGFLGDAADARWRDSLDDLRRRGRFARVPSFIVGASRPYKVELDLSGLEQAVEVPPNA